MNAFEKLISLQQKNSSLLCVGLDPDLEKMPPVLAEKKCSGIFEFNKSIIDATIDSVCGYKLNFAFYEQFGIPGFEALKKTFDYIPDSHFKIADAKRGDIGNTSKAYARSCFEYFGADSATLIPYMGLDGIKPFLDFSEKLNFIVTLSSNSGANDFQRLVSNGQPLFASVIEKAGSAFKKENLGFVVGATYPEELKFIRETAEQRVFLIPGIGAQGGNIKSVLRANNRGPCVIAVSRSILYASRENDFAEKAYKAAAELKAQINS